MRFIIITHNFFAGSSDGFDTIEIEAKDLDDAHDQGAAIAYRKSGSFSHCRYTVVTMEDGEKLVNRKLTFLERLTGRLKL